MKSPQGKAFVHKNKRLIAGLVGAALALILMLVYSSNVRAQASASRSDALARYGGEQVEVYVAVRDIAAGETLGLSDIEARVWVADLLPRNAVLATENVLGQTVSSSVLTNEPLCWDRIGTAQKTMTVPEGYCAISIPAEDVQAVGGAIASGSLVDIYYRGDSSVSLLAERVLVLETSTGASVGGDDGGDSQESSGKMLQSGSSKNAALSWITIAVKPELVEELIASTSVGALYLTIPGKGVSEADVLDVSSEEEEAGKKTTWSDQDSGSQNSGGAAS